jgi:hypothetical protein
MINQIKNLKIINLTKNHFKAKFYFDVLHLILDNMVFTVFEGNGFSGSAAKYL